MSKVSELRRHDADAETRTEQAVGWWAEHPFIDPAAVAVLVGAHVIVVVFGKLGDWLLWIPATQRQTAYTTGASVIAILGSVSAIGIAIYQSVDGDRSRKLRARFGDEIRNNFRSLLAATGFCALICLVAVVANRTPAISSSAHAASGASTDPAYSRFWFEFAVGLWALRYVRIIYFFTYVLDIRDKESTDEPRRAAPSVSPAWKRSS